MKAYQHEHAHSYEHPHSVFDFKSASLFQSLITAATIGIFVGSVGVVLNAVWFYRQTSWHVTAMVQGLVQMLIVTVLVTIVLEQRRKRAIRRTLELAFLNHHVRNALTQMSMVSYIADPEKREHLLQDAAARVSEVLFRIANSVDLTGLSLEVDLGGGGVVPCGRGARAWRGEEGELSQNCCFLPYAHQILSLCVLGFDTISHRRDRKHQDFRQEGVGHEVSRSLCNLPYCVFPHRSRGCARG
jgi:hypothetical protein